MHILRQSLDHGLYSEVCGVGRYGLADAAG